VKKPPNILFLMSDEHRADIAGFAGDDVVRTPHLDWLSRTGITFTNAYTPSPICIPSRQSMMAGQFPRTCGCEKYGQDLAPNAMTFARRLAEYGYETVVSGKLHHMGPDQMQGWTHRISGDMHIDVRYLGEKAHQHRRTSDMKWSDTKEILRAGIGRGPVVTFDEYAVEGALNFIENYFVNGFYDREQEHPVLLKVSLLQPHYPYLTSKEKFNYYLNRVNPYLNETVFDHPFLSQRQVRPGMDASERELRRATAAYYGMIETIDDMYGRVLEALRHVGENLDDWIIIYTSDHGEMLGQHGIWEKQKFFEGSVKVPLIIRFPSRFSGGTQVEANVNLCDLFATLCELTDVPAPEGLDSRSLVPLLKDADTPNWDNETISQFGGKNLMIKRDHLKYHYYGEALPEVLFDLKRNAEETLNYIDDPLYADHVAQFRNRRTELNF
jgi:choline-sulfatase